MKQNKYTLLIMLLVLIVISLIFVVFKNKKTVDTIDKIAWNNDKANYKIYIKENGIYIPYLVVDNNYNKSRYTLVIRENILSDDNYTIDYNGSIYKEKVNGKSFLMNSPKNANYDDTDVDKFLTTEFINYFDNDFIDLLNDTEISVQDIASNNEETYLIKRKFFVLSIGELYQKNTYNKHDKQKNKYFKNKDLSVKNDNNENVNYWTRSFCWMSYCAIGYSGALISQTGTEAKYGIRPAFTVPNNIKIKTTFLNNSSEKIYVFDY